MKTNSTFLTKSLLVLGVFGVTTFITYGAVSTGGGVLKSSPYEKRNTQAETKLSTLTNGSGAGILDGVVAKIKVNAKVKGDTMSQTQNSSAYITAYNDYIDSRLTILDNLDNDIKKEVGSDDYVFIFQYIYPRIFELKLVQNSTDDLITRIQVGLGINDNPPTSTGSSNIINLKVEGPGVIQCGDPTRNDYTTYSPVGGKVVLLKDTCIAKGGKVWIRCQSENLQLSSVSTLVEGTYSCPSMIPPPIITCSGTLPSGSGVHSLGYQVNSFGGGSKNGTEWINEKDTSDFGCTWGCNPGFKRNGNNGCTVLAAGEGITIHVLDSATQQPLSGVSVDLLGSLGMAGSLSFGIHTTDSAGTIPEFFWSSKYDGYTMILILNKSGYTAQSGTVCKLNPNNPNHCFLPYRYAGTDHNITIYMSPNVQPTESNPTIILTNSNNVQIGNLMQGEVLYGYIQGGNINNTWSCLDAPGQSTCTNGGTTGWRKLGADTNDDWQIQGDTIKLKGFSSQGFPTGTYKAYVKTGLNGNNIKETSFTLNPNNKCTWQYHPVAGPVGSTNPEINDTNCTQGNNGVNAMEIGGNHQNVATCTCN